MLNASFPKTHRIGKKNLLIYLRTKKEKLHYLISHFLVCFVELVGRLYFCLAKGLIDGLAIGKVELKRKKIVIGFFE